MYSSKTRDIRVLRSRSGHMRPPHLVRFIQSSTDDADTSSVGVYATAEDRGRGSPDLCFYVYIEIRETKEGASRECWGINEWCGSPVSFRRPYSTNLQCDARPQGGGNESEGSCKRMG